jgi:diguanylate cyclase (GGDEF)-like protein
MKRAEALRTEISIAPMRTSEGNFPVTLSLGAAAIAPDMDKSAKSILRLADEALYRAKRGGRNRVELANLVLA